MLAKKPFKTAFGLIETLIAVSIIALVLAVSVTLGATTLRNISLNTQNAQATALAQEQIETLRSMRDTAWIKKSYTYNSTACAMIWDCLVGSRHNSKIIPETSYFISYYDASKYYYLYPSAAGETIEMELGEGNKIAFQRKLIFKEIDPSTINSFELEDETFANLSQAETGSHDRKIYKVLSTVSWSNFDQQQEVTLTTYLSDWMPRF